MFYNKSEMKGFRKKLRNNMTPAEIKLWTHIKNRQLAGNRFRRQYSMGNYILDFYCPAKRVAVELDGDIHNQPKVKHEDRLKEEFFIKRSVTIIRFQNKEVFQNIDRVLKTIETALTESDQ